MAKDEKKKTQHQPLFKLLSTQFTTIALTSMNPVLMNCIQIHPHFICIFKWYLINCQEAGIL